MHTDNSFPFINLKFILHYILTCTVLDEKFDVILIFVSKYGAFFSPPLSAFKIFSLSLFLNNLSMMCPGVVFSTFLVLEVH